MKRLWVAAAVVGIGAGVLGGWWVGRRPAPPARQARAFDVMMSAPHWDANRVEESLAASDAVTARRAEAGEPPLTGASIRDRLLAANPSEGQLLEFFEANRARFGGRSFEESRHAVDQLVRIQLVRGDLGAPAPDNGFLQP